MLLADSVYSNPLVLVISAVYLVFILWCAYRTAVNHRWVFFILGFFCGGIFWIIGALLGRAD